VQFTDWIRLRHQSLYHEIAFSSIHKPMPYFKASHYVFALTPSWSSGVPALFQALSYSSSVSNSKRNCAVLSPGS
jgi:hypothetical protein